MQMPDPLSLHVTVGYGASNRGVEAHRWSEQTREEAHSRAWQESLMAPIQWLISQPPPVPPLPPWPVELAGAPDQRLAATSLMISKLVELTGREGGLIHAVLKRLDTFEGHELSAEEQWLEIARRDLSPLEADSLQICLTALRLLTTEQRRQAAQAVLA